MIGQGLERPDKGKWVARPKKWQRQAPKYVVRVPTTLPTIADPSPSSVRPPSTLAVDLTPTPTVHPSPTSAVHPSATPVADPLPPLVNITPIPPPVIINPTLPPVLITPTPAPVLITPTPPPDPTFIPSSSSIPFSEIVTPSADPDSAGDRDGVDPPLHD
ncbi:hypothetical protein LR48_Vigan08g073300 [Vigna angularis]|uniref:Uncharacterized protein n=1 Tax=Phaseolus angularis TaxID=3914 RepID=A0A0L9V4H5_PHAAN|nr:vegetative cell wall protein gp1 [Vigna angularis]KOM49906.1 hypothetical protein LR48_Vigan08g073300 [Vigna angularis]